MRNHFFQLSVSALMAQMAMAAYIPSDPWTTLTPDSPTPSGALTNFDGVFGLSVKTISTNQAEASGESSINAKVEGKQADAITQISDGQVQATSATTTASALNQISDGQVQVQTTATPTASVVNQISDGQIQQQTTSAAAVLNQISDGQVQQQTTTAVVLNQISDGQVQQQTSTAVVLNQISDGQVQQQTTTASVVNQISDGQVQEQTVTVSGVVTQISDGQVQQTTASLAAQISDGQAQATATGSSTSTSGSTTYSGLAVSCKTDSSLALKLNGTILTDSHGRIGSIVANRQFQFDGPPPQAGAIYAAGWSITSDYKLAIGNQTTFFKCLSGDFYNLYDQSIGGQCSKVELDVIELVSC